MSGKPVIAEDPGMKRFIEMARQDLAKRLKLAEADIEVVEARYVTWPDGSAGCPKPGFMYAQAITNGTYIRLRAASNVYRYHSSQQQPPSLCESATPQEPLDYEYGAQ